MSRYIDADKLIELANNTKDKTIDANDIARFPAADVRENVRGEWINKGFMVAECSNCKEQFHELEIANFCPNCGADMRPISALSENVEIASNLKRGES